MPRLVPPGVPAVALRGSPQPVLPADGGLVLRPWRDSDAVVLLGAYADPAVQRWHRQRLDGPDEALALIRGWHQSWQDETAGCWAVAAGPSGDVLGRVALRLRLDRGQGECGYWVLPAARGSGVAPRALASLTSWALAEVGLHRIELVHSVVNRASCRVAEKAGYPPEAVLRSALLHSDGWHDLHLHAVTANDPRPAGQDRRAGD
jgi:[ribosomal protein S5]-alanine N-acetyltransferase